MVMMLMGMGRMDIQCTTPCRYMYRTMRTQVWVSMRALMLRVRAVVPLGLAAQVRA